MLRFVLVFMLLSGFGDGALAQTFDAYLADVRKQALTDGISEATLDSALKGLVRDERVIKFDRHQPEFVQTFDQYLTARVTDFRRREGLRLYEQHDELLNEIAEAYQVDPEFIVAFWGMETNFGQYQGKYNIIRSLATLGHDQRRSRFFTAELHKALRILDEKHVTLEQFVGAWAGAMGQSQFMPSSFLSFAEDYDGDGRKNIWSSEADVFASIANYLKSAGWKPNAGWGAGAQTEGLNWSDVVSKDQPKGCRALRHHSTKMALREWQALGIDTAGLHGEGQYALFLKGESADAGYLVGGNFRAILSYNCANKYAVAVGLLADSIRLAHQEKH